MTITFEWKIINETHEVNNVKFFTTDAEQDGVKGYMVTFYNGDFKIYPKSIFKLAMVTDK